MKRKYIRHNGKWVDVTDLPRRPQVFPSIVRDSMDALVHPDGNTYDSKRAFSAATRAKGWEELGSDAPRTPPPQAEPVGIEESIATAWDQCEQGYQAPPLERMAGDVRLY